MSGDMQADEALPVFLDFVGVYPDGLSARRDTSSNAAERAGGGPMAVGWRVIESSRTWRW